MSDDREHELSEPGNTAHHPRPPKHATPEELADRWQHDPNAPTERAIPIAHEESR
jgi:hypothetical protein